MILLWCNMEGIIVCSQAQPWVTCTSHWTSAMVGPRDIWLTRGCAWLCSSHNWLINQDFKMMTTNTSCMWHFELFYDLVLLVIFPKICVNVLAEILRINNIDDSNVSRRYILRVMSSWVNFMSTATMIITKKPGGAYHYCCYCIWNDYALVGLFQLLLMTCR